MNNDVDEQHEQHEKHGRMAMSFRAQKTVKSINWFLSLIPVNSQCESVSCASNTFDGSLVM